MTIQLIFFDLLRKKTSLGNYISSLTEFPSEFLCDRYYSFYLTHATASNRRVASSAIYRFQIFNTSPFWFTGFSVNASSERLNMGEIETLEDY